MEIGPLPSSQNRVISFLDGEPDDQGRTFDDILGWIESDEGRGALEDTHDWVQQVFPNVEKSRFHPKPAEWVVTPEIARTLKTPKYQEKVRAAFYMVLCFYGLDKAFEKDNDIDGISLNDLHWLKERNHNYWRITRIIHALKIAELDKEARKFVDLLSKVYEKVPEKIGPKSLEFWKRAASEYT